MKAMILAAGRGNRMRPLSDSVPKPLLEVQGRPLIAHHLQRLQLAGIRDVVINVSYRGQQIMQVLGDGSNFGLNIQYSEEDEPGLETAGGIIKALPLLGDEPFMVINGDVWTDYPLQNLPQTLTDLAYLVLVPNPLEHPDGDFYLKGSKLHLDQGERLTFSGIGVYQSSFFAHLQPERLALAPLLRTAITKQQVGGEHYSGVWVGVDTPERLAYLNS